MAEEAQSRQNKDNQNSTARGEWADSKAGKRYVSAIVNGQGEASMLEMVTDFVDLSNKKGAGRNRLASVLLNKTGLEPRVITILATKAAINCISIFSKHYGQGIKRSSMCRFVADAVHDQWRVEMFQNTESRKKLVKKLLRDFDKRSYPKLWRKRTIQNYFDAEQVDWQGWSPAEKLSIGYALVCMFRNATGFIEFSDCGTWVRPTDAYVEHVRQLTGKQVLQYMLYRPMVIPPKRWDANTNLLKGGYYSDKVRRYAIIKGAGKRDIKRMMEMDWSKVLPAINALQETPWVVNKRMLDAVRWSFFELNQRLGHHRGIGKLPHCDEEPLPPLPWDYETNEEVKKTHNREVFLVRDRRREAKGRRISAHMVLAIADEMKQYERIYFPHNLDSRGRAYPVPAFLNPQGPDYVKALLEFAEGQPLDTPEAVEWIAIAGANAYGKDKISLAERVQWVRDNEEMILSIAKDYKHDLRWLDAGEPFQFLRFCIEWSDYRALGDQHLSHMVVPVDATCSGLQHYAAMLRDEVGGRSVNLVPGLSRQDIYGDVAAETCRLLAEDGSPIALDWLAFGIDRKITKRQVMVVPYAGKFSSCMGYTREAVDEKLALGVKPNWDIHNQEDHQARLVLLAKYIWASIDKIVVKGKEAMNWLSKVASEYSKSLNLTDLPVYDRRMTWTTPDGFEVVHFREDEKMHRVETVFEGRVRLSYYGGTGQLSPKDMALAVAPNFVHALDANHLRSTIIKALDQGISNFGMVHDSFGVHARLMPKFLRECVKPAFVEMYQNDVLAKFADRFRPFCAIPDLPEPGKLDLQGVLRSEFFFS
ncbi:DNA-directed RNA polymerase [Rhodoblastus acidophilus]|uniref:DNA-directed RNA polymerase n=3 Tax=Rhodoblastus acidophilus TaxID=1074 RepID=UPI0022254A27|nr:DNA-directed RNA polymerase [Rhodoblastus acidophilus]MCW2286865.1 DNA-directed RNA polymerase [Rhodoblastus acidophilus]